MSLKLENEKLVSTPSNCSLSTILEDLVEAIEVGKINVDEVFGEGYYGQHEIPVVLQQLNEFLQKNNRIIIALMESNG